MRLVKIDASAEFSSPQVSENKRLEMRFFSSWGSNGWHQLKPAVPCLFSLALRILTPRGLQKPGLQSDRLQGTSPCRFVKGGEGPQQRYSVASQNRNTHGMELQLGLLLISAQV